MLKNTITANEFNAFPADSPIRAEYKLVGTDYILQHDEDNGALKRSLERANTRNTTLEADLTKVEGERDTLKREATKQGTPAAIAAEARQKALDEVKPQLERGTKLETRLKTQELSKQASDLALKIGGEKNKIALLPHIERRLDVELDSDDNPKLVIKGADGKASTLKAEDLEKEIRADKNLASLVIVSAANGGNGRQQQQGTQFQRQSPASAAGEKKDLGSMTPDERKAHIQEKYVNNGAATATA